MMADDAAHRRSSRPPPAARRPPPAARERAMERVSWGWGWGGWGCRGGIRPPIGDGVPQNDHPPRIHPPTHPPTRPWGCRGGHRPPPPPPLDIELAGCIAPPPEPPQSPATPPINHPWHPTNETDPFTVPPIGYHRPWRGPRRRPGSSCRSMLRGKWRGGRGGKWWGGQGGWQGSNGGWRPRLWLRLRQNPIGVAPRWGVGASLPPVRAKRPPPIRPHGAISSHHAIKTLVLYRKIKVFIRFYGPEP